MNALYRLTYRLRAWRIDRLRARIRNLERRQRRALTRLDRKSTRLNSSHLKLSRMPSSA